MTGPAPNYSTAKASEEAGFTLAVAWYQRISSTNSQMHILKFVLSCHSLLLSPLDSYARVDLHRLTIF